MVTGKTDSDLPITEVVRDRLAGQSYQEIAKSYGTTTTKVRNICQKYQTSTALQGEIALADPTRLFRGATVFPYNPSILVTRKGMRIFDAMRNDDQIKAAMLFKKMAVMATSWEIVSPEGHDQEWEPTRFLENQLMELPYSFDDTLLEIMSAFDFGYSISEIVYKEIEEGDWAGKIGLRAVKTRRPHEIDFKTDEFGNLKAVQQEQPVTGRKDLPPDKFILFVHQREFSNFYGRSDLEAAYRPWWIKENAYRWLAMLLERFGIPPIFALYDPTAMNPTQISQLVSVVQRIQAATAGAIPRSSKDALELWSPELGGQVTRVFIPAMKMFNEDIARALLMPGLLGATSDSREGSFARAKVQFDVFMLMVQRTRGQLQDLVADQLVKPLLDLNFASLDDYPQFRFLPLTDETRLDVMEQWSKFVQAKVVKPQDSDEEHIRALFNFPERDEEQVREEPTPPTVPPQPGEGDTGDEVEPGGPPVPPVEGSEQAAAQRTYQALSRKPNRFEKRVDFAQINDRLDQTERRAKEKLVAALRGVRDSQLRYVEKQFTGDISQIEKATSLKGLPRVRKAFVEFLMETLQQGMETVRSELKDVPNVPKEFQTRPNFNATDAGKFLRARADFFVTGLNADLTKKSKNILANAISTGELARETSRKLRKLYEPWVGDPNVIRDGKVIEPHRLETIVRTNATTAFNQGRLIQARRAGDLVEAFEYSAIIDTRTTEVCRKLDGRVIRRDDPNLDKLTPPRHFSCRSVLVPVTLDVEIKEDDILTERQAAEGLTLSGEGFGKPPVTKDTV